MTPASDIWSTPAFLEELSAWVAGVVGVRPLAREQVHVRPWSTAVRFGCPDGRVVWGKANAIGTRHEPALTAALARVEPDLVPEVLAVDKSRGWSLTADAGPALRTALPVDERWSVWEDVLPRYAAAQRRCAGAEGVRAAGAPDVTPERMPELLRDLVDELSSKAEDDGGLTAEGRVRIEARFDDVVGVCAELAASGLPSSIQHDDLHGGNVCVAVDRGGGCRASVIDWGDASWGFPLGTMLVTLDAIAANASCAVDDPRVQRVRDAYLEPFGADFDRADLLRWTELARWVGALTRALSWGAALLDASPAARREYGAHQRTWLGWLASGG